ncbi:MAG: DUF3429 domain-containing protein, partial [Pseudomonadota bacterium]
MTQAREDAATGKGTASEGTAATEVSAAAAAQYDLSDVPPPARWLGLAGLLPFAGLTLLAIATPDAINEEARTLLAAYGAAILSFMGGCRWGFASAG